MAQVIRIELPKGYDAALSLNFSYLKAGPHPEIWRRGRGDLLTIVYDTPVVYTLTNNGRAFNAMVLGELDEKRAVKWLRAKLGLDHFRLAKQAWGVFEELGIAHHVAPARGFFPVRLSSPPWLIYEGICKAVLYQMLSVPAAHGMITNTAQNLGPKVIAGGETFYGWPSPEILASKEPEELKAAIKTSYMKATALKSIAEVALAEDLETWANLPTDDLMTRLQSLKGVGEWTARITVQAALYRFEVEDASRVASVIEKRTGVSSDQALGVLTRCQDIIGLVAITMLYAEELRRGRYYK